MQEQLKYKPNVKADRRRANEIDVDVRKSNFEEVDTGFTAEDAVFEAGRCIDCANPTCVDACPVNVKIPAFLEAIRNEDFARGIDIIREDNLLPSICGRVCPQENQCEGACILEKKGKPIAIGQLERFLGDKASELATPAHAVSSNGKKVAVVGAGPSGIACAGELARKGFDVTVFEALFRPGGVLTYGIPTFRLPNEVVDRELSELSKLGVNFEYNSVVGRIVDADELFAQGFEAMYVAVGAGSPQFLNIPGENASGVQSANEFLTRVNLMSAHEDATDTPIQRGKNVIVFGAGNVAMDAARTALRMGADSVKLAYRRSMDEIPARAAEVSHALAEGIEVIELVAPLEIMTTDKNWISGVHFQKMELGDADESGRRRPVAIEGETLDIACDMAIVAIGTRVQPLLKLAAPDAELTSRGYVAVDGQGRTSNSRIWAGGDVATGAATVIEAMGAGKRAAASIACELL